MGLFGKNGVAAEPPVVDFDSTAYILNNSYSDFVTQHTIYIQFMCLVGYTYVHGVKVFKAVDPKSSIPFKFAYLVMACTGGGILVPIFLNKIPVPIASDVYVVAITVSFLLHQYLPIVREVYKLSTILQALFSILYEITRAGVVCKFTKIAATTIAPSAFSFPLFGPIICGTIAGCGGAFFPLSKGLDPVKIGVPLPIQTAFIGATAYHLFVNIMGAEIVDAAKKGQVLISTFFIFVSLKGLLFQDQPKPKSKAE